MHAAVELSGHMQPPANMCHVQHRQRLHDALMLHDRHFTAQVLQTRAQAHARAEAEAEAQELHKEPSQHNCWASVSQHTAGCPDAA
jgi:hypothetical protein